MSPQGSFRYGTVNRPLIDTRSTTWTTSDHAPETRRRPRLTQRQLKTLYGSEIKAYAKANSMLAPVTGKNRCWRLVYADEVKFHLDTLPCVPEEQAVILQPDVARRVA